MPADQPHSFVAGDLLAASLPRDAEVPSGWTMWCSEANLIVYRFADGSESVIELERMGAIVARPNYQTFEYEFSGSIGCQAPLT